MGHPYGANEERGVFRTTDGGNSWEKVLYLDRNTGASIVEIDPSDPRTLYAGLWEHREGPWENASFSGPGTGLYKSTDGGGTWRRLSLDLPTGEWGPLFVGIAPSDPRRVYVTVSARGGGGLFRSDDGGERFAQSLDRSSPGWGRARSSPGSGRGVRRNDRRLSVGRRRTELHVHQGRARRRRLPAHLDQPGSAGRHAVHRRSGCGRHRQRRKDLELLVQPADRAALSRLDRQPVSVLDLRRTAGKRRDRDGEPGKRGTDLVPRLDGRRGGRVRVRRARSLESANRLRRPGRPLRQAQRTDAERRAGSAALGPIPHAENATAPLSPRGPDDAALCDERAVADDDGRIGLARHEPGPFPRAPGSPGKHRRFRDRGSRADAAPRRHLCRRSISAPGRHDLGRNRRRTRARHPRWRQELEGRDAEGASFVGQGLADRCGPFRRRHRVRRGQRFPPRRPAASPVSNPRRRSHLDPHRERTRGSGADERRARGPEEARSPLRGNGARGLLLDR